MTSSEFETMRKTQLADAIAQAKSDSEFRGGGFRLVPTTNKKSGEFGFTIDSLNPRIHDANLLIIANENEDVVQFAFPSTVDQPLDVSDGELKQFGFFPGIHLGHAVADPTRWIVKAALKVVKKAATDAIGTIAREAEKQLKKEEGWIDLNEGFDVRATAERLAQAKGKRVLLFVHGIFSSIHGAFSDLAAGPAAMDKLRSAYDGYVFGYDHWTISKTPLENTLDLLAAIPADADWSVDIVCHSRGGLIVRSLVADPGGANLANAELNAIASQRQGRINSVGKIIFAAAANQGSQLADPGKIKDFLNIAALLASRSPCFALDVVIGLARALVAAAFDLPSIRQLATTSDLVKDLNNAATLITSERVFGVRADFDGSHSILLEAGVVLDKLLMAVDNDLVVPYEGVAYPHPAIAAASILEFGTPTAKQGTVWHTQLFEQPDTHDFLCKQLVAS